MRRERSLAACLVLAAVSSVAVGFSAPKPVTAPASQEPEFAPGKETVVYKDSVGGYKHFRVYLPSNYTPARTWPVIFNYHPIEENPQTWPFREAAGGRDFIIVGAEYVDRGQMNLIRIDSDIENLQNIYIPFVTKHFNVDPSLFFVGGYGRGGTFADELARRAPNVWAGAIILAGLHSKLPQGRRIVAWNLVTGTGKLETIKTGTKEAAKPPPPPAPFSKPVFLAVGEKDQACTETKEMAEAFKKMGADVTLDVQPGEIRLLLPNSEPLRGWLAKYALLKKAPLDMEEARKAEQAGRPGDAYATYAFIARIDPKDPVCVQAAAEAKRVSAAAEKLLTEGMEAVAADKTAEGARKIAQAANQFQGSDFARLAAERLNALRDDPKTRAEVERAEADIQAESLEQKAQAAENAQEYAEAIRLYEQYAASYPKASRFDEVRKHLDALKADKKVIKAVKTKQAAPQCTRQLELADNFLSLGLRDKARPILEKIIADFPDTDFADQAAERLKLISEK